MYQITYISAIDDQECIICRKHISTEKLITMRADGIRTLMQSCITRGCNSLLEYLNSAPTKILLHNCCRMSFNDLRKLKRLKFEEDDNQSACSSNTRSLRSERDSFDWKSKCFFCTKYADKEKPAIHSVTTLEMLDRLRECCAKRADIWAVEVKGRL